MGRGGLKDASSLNLPTDASDAHNGDESRAVFYALTRDSIRLGTSKCLKFLVGHREGIDLLVLVLSVMMHDVLHDVLLFAMRRDQALVT